MHAWPHPNPFPTLRRSKQDSPRAPCRSTIHLHAASVCRQVSVSQPFHEKASACPLAHPPWEATSTGESFLFALMMERLITHGSAFQIAEAGRGGKNTIKAIASKHGLSGTMMNGLEEACVYSRSIIRCCLADSRQEGRRHSLLESGLLFLLLAEV